MSVFKSALSEGAAELGFGISDVTADTLDKYRLYLSEKNKELNLTAVEGELELAQRHFLDSLSLLPCTDFR